MEIQPVDISVVVQGPIVGSPTDPLDKRLTYQCLESVRKYLPGSEIILSTWKGSNTNGLSYDILVENEDPGATICHYRLKLYNNINRQIVSTKSGLQQAAKKFAMKIRSDMILKGNGFLKYFGLYKKRADEWKILQERVLVCTIFSKNPKRIFPFPFHPSDWFFFGLRDDVLSIWDVPFAREPEISKWFENKPRPVPDLFPHFLNRYFPEQYLWITFLRKYGSIDFDYIWDLSKNSVELSEKTITNNLVLLEPHQLQIKFLKYKIKFYDWASVYTHGEWLRMYNKYCDGNVFLHPDLNVLIKKLISCISLSKYLNIFLAKLILSDQDILIKWERKSPKTFIIAKSMFNWLTR